MGGTESLQTYLNDHLAGGEGALELAEHLRTENQGSTLARFLGDFIAEVTEDHETLTGLVQRLGLERTGLKQAAAWLGEKLSRVKLGAGSGSDSLGTLLSLEMLAIGVEGKRCLWRSLQTIELPPDQLGGIDLDALIRRAEGQRGKVETFRLAAATAALTLPRSPTG